MPLSFAVTFDYLCPFARNLNEHVVAGLEDGADWQVTFTPYSLAQGHLEEGQRDVWEADDPWTVPGLLALTAGLAVRDHFPAAFLDAHQELFAARHDRGEDLKDRRVVEKALEAAGADPQAVMSMLDARGPLATARVEHDDNVRSHHVWGVPTVIAGDRAVFIRLMDRPVDATASRARIERLVELITEFPELHEFKQTDLPM